MALAVDLSRRNVEMNTGGPFGAAVFTGAGRLVAVGVNRVVPDLLGCPRRDDVAYVRPGACSAIASTRAASARAGHQRAALLPVLRRATVWAGIDELLIGARAGT